MKTNHIVYAALAAAGLIAAGSLLAAQSSAPAAAPAAAAPANVYAGIARQYEPCGARPPAARVRA
jgi:hypothetical protein